jgi:hypothetical protein
MGDSPLARERRYLPDEQELLTLTSRGVSGDRKSRLSAARRPTIVSEGGQVLDAPVDKYRGIGRSDYQLGIRDDELVHGERWQQRGQNIFLRKTAKYVDFYEIRAQEEFKNPHILFLPCPYPGLFMDEEDSRELRGSSVWGTMRRYCTTG